MLQLTYESGTIVQRLLTGYLATAEDIPRLVKELTAEVTDGPVIIEVWRSVTAKRKPPPDIKEVIKSSFTDG